MLFSSTVFVFAYLPCVILLNILLRRHRNAQNIMLLAASLLFYAWGEPAFLPIMLFTITVNWIFAMLINKEKRQPARIIYLVISLIINIGVLFVFKYLAFTLESFNFVFGRGLTIPDIALPIGISFYTFQAMSYVIDVYRGNGTMQKNPLNVGLYIAFFPQLIAGPIVRYETVAEQIQNRTETCELFSHGVCRFIVGLGKKTVIANSVAVIADYAFGAEELTVLMAWLGAVSYMIQIYFDFSGYSDMAIGLGGMFGFKFPENFNYPYSALSVSDFWRRWHILMGMWFRDYVYFPLGGSRVKSKSRLVFNLFVVWMLTGLWHGASLTFIVWGLMYFVLITIEKLTGAEKKQMPKALRYIGTMTAVLAGWVIFRSDSIEEALHYFGRMLGAGGELFDSTSLVFLSDYTPVLILGILMSFPVVPHIAARISEYPRFSGMVKTVSLVLVFFISVVYIVKNSYNPFIYFRF